jgi:predicted nucleic acid-binding protein
MPNASNEFIDTNVLVYEWDSSDPVKRDKARKVVKKLAHRGIVSSQVAQEFAWTARRKLGLSSVEVAKILHSYARFQFVPIEFRHVQMALETADSCRISFWDALIVEAAASASCEILLTEDLNHDQVIRGVRVINPFR